MHTRRRQEARRRALLAAARVAFLATAGCTKEVPASAPAPTTPATPATSVATGPGGCQLPSSDSPTEQETKCCLSGAETVAKNQAGMDNGPDPRAPASIVACCTHVVLFRDRERRSPHYDACCAVLGTMSGACTPWGPPMPPRMIARIV